MDCGKSTISIKRLYKVLLDEYGPQGWWPADTPFEVMVGAVLTQNTAWKNVERAIEALKREKCLNPLKLMACPRDRLKDLIRPAGFYNQKAERLKLLAGWFVERGGLEALSRLTTEELRKELLSIKGIGRETADSILLYAFNRPVFVVDKYTYRLFTRLGLWEGVFDYEGIRKMVENELRRVEDLKEFHALIVEHSKARCKKRPRCDDCPLKVSCQFYC